MIKQVDVVVVGASIVGLSFANAMSGSGMKVAVIDANAPVSAPAAEPAMRVSAISLASQQAFEKLGVWQQMQQERIAAYQHMRVWEQDSFAKIAFDALSTGTESLGTIIENDNLIAALHLNLQSSDNVSLHYGAGIKQMNIAYPNHLLQLDDGQTFITKLIVGADGANSIVRKTSGFPLTFWSYDQKAIVATVNTQEMHGHTARQVFTATGPLAFLPLWQEHQCSIVWSQDVDQADHLLALSDRDFEKALTATFDVRLGNVRLSGERRAFPLKMQYARQWAADGIALIGDAAHTIHPLAGQGANLGIMDALALAETLQQQDSSESGFANHTSLRQFERWRKAEASKMIATMEGFKRLFASNNPVKKLVRGLGMSAVDHLPLLKQQIIEQALGSSGHLPALAKTGS
ncbi:MAG: FAD-dependent monooxygenase [Aestuariibacter sp.]